MILEHKADSTVASILQYDCMIIGREMTPHLTSGDLGVWITQDVITLHSVLNQCGKKE